MKKCFISKMPVLELPGEFVVLDLALLGPADQAALTEGAHGYGYVKHVAASAWADFWMQRQLRHAVDDLGMVHVADLDGTQLLRHPLSGVFTMITQGACMSALPPLVDLEAGERLPPYRKVRLRVPLHVEGIPSTLAQAMQAALLQSKSVPLDGLIETLGIQACFRYPEAVADARLRLNSALRATWQPDGFAADCDCFLMVPETVVQAIRNVEAGKTPVRDLDMLLQQANALAAGGDTASLGDALILLSENAVYFGAADRERIYRTHEHIQQEIFDQTEYNLDELDAIPGIKTVDPNAFSTDLD